MLTATEDQALQIEAAHYVHPGAKVSRIHAELHMTETRHAAIVLSLLDDPRAEAAHPALVRRLRRLRDRRRAARRG